MTESGSVQFGDSAIDYTVVRSRKRRKTIEIALDPERGVVVAAPLRVSKKEINELVVRRADWIIRRMGRWPSTEERRQFITGELLPLLDVEIQLSVERHKSSRVHVASREQELRVSLPEGLDEEARRDAVRMALTRWYQDQAREWITERLAYWAKVAGYSPKSVLVRSQRKRWGSCSADGTLRINWRIVMAPADLADYVLVHELAHVRVKNHSSDFWAEVSRLMPDHKLRRKRLGEIGQSLNL